ncbi:MAG: XRE family transcriptional regulator [Oceanibaculum nanhaiense]|jgi:transcriptional regulator with XRE-family HTH domain|uniref:helix-turn-helix domain-containing protein n=1 Tax=Oceanibaculum nanhaiense TaxID=1909734 RepID=UPI0032EF7E4B
MDSTLTDTHTIEDRLAQRLRALRGERGWTLDETAARSGISRATLSRLEKAEVSPTARVLGQLCAAYGLTLSRLMHLVEAEFAPLVPRAGQPVWHDAESGFHRRSVSPPAQSLAGEVLEGRLDPGARIAYDRPPRPGLEHHIVLLEGALAVTLGERTHDLQPGDCLRYQLFGASVFATPPHSGALYLIFIL